MSRGFLGSRGLKSGCTWDWLRTFPVSVGEGEAAAGPSSLSLQIPATGYQKCMSNITTNLGDMMSLSPKIQVGEDQPPKATRWTGIDSEVEKGKRT